VSEDEKLFAPLSPFFEEVNVQTTKLLSSRLDLPSKNSRKKLQTTCFVIRSKSHNESRRIVNAEKRNANASEPLLGNP